MNIIKESPEHHFLTFLDKIKQDPGGWTGLHFAFSKKLKHAEIIENLEHIKGKLHKIAKENEALIRTIEKEGSALEQATLYRFTDSDLILMVRPQNGAGQEQVKKLFATLAAQAGEKLSQMSNLGKDIYAYQKLADERFLSARKMQSYEAMADTNRVRSIPLRKQRRDDPLIMIVEDDRFTASYAANLLNKDYDIVVAKTGEEAISFYIEHAPDMVLLDIHLPGLSGHDTLRALIKIDPAAYVVMLSVDTVKHNIVAATEAGAAGFLKKPFSKERLIGTVEKAPFIKRYKSKGGPSNTTFS